MEEVRIFGDPVLRKKAVPVAVFDESLKGLAHEMIEVMREKDGVGLAAPQIGKSIRIAVIDASGGEREPYVLVNPEITYMSEKREDYEEGCLSVPDINLNVNRPSIVSVKALDENGTAYAIENADGLLARAIQHEIDHLDGILFVDRASFVLRQMVAGKLKKLVKRSAEIQSLK
jgi:peptide deformylase